MVLSLLTSGLGVIADAAGDPIAHHAGTDKNTVGKRRGMMMTVKATMRARALVVAKAKAKMVMEVLQREYVTLRRPVVRRRRRKRRRKRAAVVHTQKGAMEKEEHQAKEADAVAVEQGLVGEQRVASGARHS